MAVEIISTAGQAHLVRAFYSAFYRDVIWIYLLQSCRRCCGQEKEKSAKRRVFLSLKDLKLRILKIDEVSGAVLNIFFKRIHFMLALCFARLHETSELLSWCYETWRRRILKRNTQLVLSAWSTSNKFTRNSWRSFPQWSLSNVYRSHCWPKVNLSLLGNHTPSIRFRSSYNLRVTQSYELPVSKLRSLGTLPPAAELEMKSWTRKKQWVV